MKTSSNDEVKLDGFGNKRIWCWCYFWWNEKYIENNTTQRLIIEEEVVWEDVGEKTIYGYWDTG